MVKMPRRLRSKFILAAGISAVVLIAGEAQAQPDQATSAQPQSPGAPPATPMDNTPSEAPADPIDQSAATDEGVVDLFVTAQKRSENIQDVPIAVTAMSGDTISNLRATTLQGLAGAVPSIQINNYVNTPNTAAVYIRGMGILEADPWAGQTVSIVVDGVPQFFSMGALLNLYDVDRVEVLRGPQGTLFGANTTGGVVNVVTRQPSGEFGGRFDVTYGNWDRFEVNSAIEFPLVEDLLAARIAVSHLQRDGWVTNIVDGSDMDSRNLDAIRGSLRLTPAVDFEATLIGEYDRARNGSPAQINGGVPGEALTVPGGTVFDNAILPMYPSPCPSAATPCDAPDRYFGGNGQVPDQSDMDTYFLNLTMNWRNTPVGDITSITAYKEFRLIEYTDQDGTPLFLLDTFRDTTGWQFSQELRTFVEVGDRFEAIIGGFYLKTHYDHVQVLRLPGLGLVNIRQENPQEQDNYSLSGFAQGYFDITDELRLQAGIRYTHERTEMATELNRYGGTDGFFGGTFIPELSISANGAKSWDNVGWRLGFDYRVTDDHLFYGYWARGFKSGGFAGRIGVPQDIGPFEPEFVDTFEIGFKTDWFDRRLRANIAIFYTDYREMQLAQQYFAEDENGVSVQGNTVLNVASASIKGVELDVTAVPVEGLTLTGSVAYLDGQYEEFFLTQIDLAGGPVQVDLAGNRLQNSPVWSGALGLNYTVPVGNGRIIANALYTYTGPKFLTSLVNAPRSRLQETHLVNASIDWQPTAANWTIGVWGRNLFDNRYLQNVFDFPGVFAFVSYQSPREYGATFRYNF
jgi:iron complex outermembrane receptor protein